MLEKMEKHDSLNKLYKKERLANVLFFDSDKDLQDFCIKPGVEIRQSTVTSPSHLMEYAFTDEYLKAIANHKQICVKDEKSSVNREGYLTCKYGSVKIDNIFIYTGDECCDDDD